MPVSVRRPALMVTVQLLLSSIIRYVPWPSNLMRLIHRSLWQPLAIMGVAVMVTRRVRPVPLLYTLLTLGLPRTALKHVRPKRTLALFTPVTSCSLLFA